MIIGHCFPYAPHVAEGSKTVDQALRLLEELRSGGPGNVADLGRRIGVSRSAAGRLLTSLETHQFTRRTEDGFDLGYGLLRFSEELGAGLRTAAALELRHLAEHFDETAALAVRDGTHAVAIAQVVPSDRVVSIQYRPGTRHALSVGAHGLAMLADVTLPLDQVDEALVPRLAEVARIGYAVSRDELEPGVTRISLRSKNNRINVNDIAKQFEGGGHPAAAGARLHGNHLSVQRKVIGALKNALNSAAS